MDKKPLDKAYFEARRKELEVAYNQMKADWQELADYFLPRSVRFLARNVNKAPANVVENDRVQLEKEQQKLKDLLSKLN